MKLALFQHLRPASQVSFALVQGTYLLFRLEAAAKVHLYHVAGEGTGFFIELTYEPRQDKLVVVRSFQQSDQLTRYLAAISLPSGC